MGFFKSDKEKAAECYEKAEQYRKQGSYDRAIPLYEKAEKLGLILAEYALGEAYYYGHGVKQNIQTAMDYYAKASKYGIHDATYMLARIMSEGTHYMPIYSMAIKFAKAAAEDGHKPSTLLYGKLLIQHPQEHGDQDLGFKVLSSCAFAGYAGALNMLADFTGVTYTVEVEPGFKKNLICDRTGELVADKWDDGSTCVRLFFEQIMKLKNKPDRSYLKSVSPEVEFTDDENCNTDENKAETFYRVAEDYYKEKQYSKMLAYHKMAADLGYGPSMNCIGYAYAHGEGVPIDQEKAFIWYMKGAEAGCAKASFNAGKYFAEGIACEVNYATAKALFYEAMIQGHEYAHHYFGRLMIEHPDSDIEIERGIEALITGIFKGFPYSLSTFNELMGENHEVRINVKGQKELVNPETGEVLATDKGEKTI